MASVNLWLALRDDAQDAIKTRLDWDTETQGDYSGPVTNRTARLFRGMIDRGTVQRLFKTPTLGGRVYTLWNIYLDESPAILQKVADELNDLTTEYPNHIAVIGAWWWDGRQVGTQFVWDDVTRQVNDPAFNQTDVPNPDYQPDPELPDYDPNETIPDPDWVAPDPWPQIDVTTNEIVGTSGTPLYPLHAQVLQLMPDVWNGDDPPTYSPATSVADVNLLMGQAPRYFS